MKIAILGDIHANLEALQSVLADIDAKGVDKVYSVGDVVGYGADPSACINLLRERNIPAVIGNWATVIKEPSLVEEYNAKAQASLYWTLGAMSEEEREFLKNLPLETEEGDVIITHSMPGDPRRYIMKAEDAERAFAETKAQVYFHGHTHLPMAFFEEDPISYTTDSSFTIPEGVRAIVNVGSVGQPRDGDPRAAYCLYDTATREVEIVRVEYDVETAADKIRRAGLPPVLADRLASGK